MSSVQIEQKSYEMPPREGISIAHFLRLPRLERRLWLLASAIRIGDDTFRGAWPFTSYRNDILCPISFDDAGAKANMRVFFDAAEAQVKGTPPEDLKNVYDHRSARDALRA